MYRKKAHIHFVGIGGIGMSGIAKILKFQGYTISGCDTDVGKSSIRDLQQLDCSIFHGNNTTGCADQSIDILVYSSAIERDNPEILAAQQRGIPTISRALMLAELMRTKYSIAIAGSHGKTTTTSLVSHILIEAQLDPTVIIGGRLKNISTNARYGDGDYLVAEADESDRSLLHLQATLALITNIDLEHLETYRDLEDVKNTFRQFLKNLPFYGKAILCTDDPIIRSMLPVPYLKTITYSLSNDADYYADSINLDVDHSTFKVHCNNKLLGAITINMPGKHNVLNSLGAIALCRDLEIPFEIIAQAVRSFKGIDRRFCYHGTFKGAEIFDDYGHHPKEIENTLVVARKRTKNKLTVVFQPHRYSRTHRLWDDFITMFLNSNIDHLIVTDIYSASEAPIAEITSQNFVKALQQRKPNFSISYCPFDQSFIALKEEINKRAHVDDLILFQGAGKVYTLAKALSKSE